MKTTTTRTLTEAEKQELGAKIAQLVDIRKPGRKWAWEAHGARVSLRFVSKASKLYGRRRVARELGAIARDYANLPGELKVWQGCFARWLDGRQRHLVPVALLREGGYVPADALALRLALAPRVISA